eukprot:4171919-Pyramimonas_sp.AAC.1
MGTLFGRKSEDRLSFPGLHRVRERIVAGSAGRFLFPMIVVTNNDSSKGGHARGAATPGRSRVGPLLRGPSHYHLRHWRDAHGTIPLLLRLRTLPRTISGSLPTHLHLDLLSSAELPQP